MIALITVAFVLTLISGLPGLFMKRGTRSTQIVSTLFHLTGCAAGIAALIPVFRGERLTAILQWPFPGREIAILVDAVAAFFLLPVFVLMAAATIYGHGYWSEQARPDTGRKLRFYYGALTAGLILVLVAGDAWSFLAGWEIVGLSAFFLVITESKKEETLRAGWIYLIATHVSTLLLFALFALMHGQTGTWLLGETMNSKSLTAVLLIGLAGFGIKAGLMPFHVWLPEAHAAAPSHISAILSGVVLKIGVYGVVRMISWFPQAAASFGTVLLFLGIVSGVLGVLFAIAQHDLKRLLAYHSIENIGIIFIGLGVAVIGENQTWGILAMSGALLHVWNHAFFKGLLFFAAGSVIHATGLRSIDALGGLMRKIPTTGIAFLTGAIAISGLPPLNGFISEWLIYVAGFKSVTGNVTAALLAVPALALIGGLAVACFVKAFSIAFLGLPRSSAAAKATGHEPVSMRTAMLALTILCFVIGLWPLVVHTPLSAAAQTLSPVQSNTAEIRSHFSLLPAGTFTTLALIAGFAILLSLSSRRKTKAVTWDCGYAAPNHRMQYTASSFASPQVELFRWALRPEVHQPAQLTLFPQRASFESHVPDPVLNRILAPTIVKMRAFLSRARVIQTGHIQVYIVYVVATLLILLIWSLQ